MHQGLLAVEKQINFWTLYLSKKIGPFLLFSVFLGIPCFWINKLHKMLIKKEKFRMLSRNSFSFISEKLGEHRAHSGQVTSVPLCSYWSPHSPDQRLPHKLGLPFHHHIHLATGLEYNLISHSVPLRKSYISTLQPAWEGGKCEELTRSWVLLSYQVVMPSEMHHRWHTMNTID